MSHRINFEEKKEGQSDSSTAATIPASDKFAEGDADKKETPWYGHLHIKRLGRSLLNSFGFSQVEEQKEDTVARISTSSAPVFQALVIHQSSILSPFDQPDEIIPEIDLRLPSDQRIHSKVKITIEDIQKILGLHRFIFRDSDELVKIKKFVQSIQDANVRDGTRTSQKRNLDCQELIDFYRLLINIKMHEKSDFSATIISLLELFYPKEDKPRTKTREYSSDTHFEDVFRTLDKFKFFYDPNHFLYLCDFIANNNKGWRAYYFTFYAPIGGTNDPIDLLDGCSNNEVDGCSNNEGVELSRYYYAIVRALWMLKQLNMLTSKNVDILKKICLPMASQINALSTLIDFCAVTHENLLFTKWHYEKFIKAEEKKGRDYKLESQSLDRIQNYIRRWLVGLFDAYRLLIIESQTKSGEALSRFIDFFESSQEWDDMNKYFYSDSERDMGNMVDRYSKTLRMLHDHQLLTPSAALIILRHSDPQSLLDNKEYLIEVARTLPECESYAIIQRVLFDKEMFLRMVKDDSDLKELADRFQKEDLLQSKNHEELIVIFERKEAIIKNKKPLSQVGVAASVLGQAFREVVNGSNPNGFFKNILIPRELLIEIVQHAANDHSKEAQEKAHKSINKPNL